MGNALEAGPKNPERLKKGFLLQHDEHFKFHESYKTDWYHSRCSVLGGLLNYIGEL
jgi:hypothetical protein